MIKQFEKLTKQEIELLSKAPVFVSVLAASSDREISNNEKADAIKLAHLKTFTAYPLLIPYYKEVEKNFKSYFEAIVKIYAPFDDAKREELKQEIYSVNALIGKLDKEFASALHTSLSEYAEHVRKADNNAFVNFVFPLPIEGLTY